MADLIAGDVRQIKADHKVHGPMLYEQKSGAENKLDAGGNIAADDDAGITNAGSMIFIFNKKRGKISLEVTLTTGCHDYTKKTQEDLETTTYVITYADGSTVNCVGRPVGNIVADKQAGTMSLTLALKPFDL